MSELACISAGQKVLPALGLLESPFCWSVLVVRPSGTARGSEAETKLLENFIASWTSMLIQVHGQEPYRTGVKKS
jgi:hypothetical protein